MSRIAAGKLRINKKAVDLCNIIEMAIDEVRSIAEVKRVTLQTDVSTRGGEVVGDATRLQQVLLNLLNNAIKFTPAGGQVKVVLKLAGTWAEVRVADTGRGIAKDFLTMLFNRFTQADCENTSTRTGLGLGLSIAHDLVLAHNGTIEATSPGLDQGSTFTVRLPLAARPAFAPRA